MSTPQTNSLFMATDVVCRILGVDPQVMLRTAGLGAFYLVVAVENIRGAAVHLVCPVAAGFDGSEEERRRIAGPLGIMPTRSQTAYMAFSPEDAKRRFISENPALWAGIEADLNLQLAARNAPRPMADRVRGALVDLMPAGRTGAEDVALALGISRSTLQRRLRDDATSYQAVLDATRRDMAIRYLTKTTLRADEIASVLAYRDANRFFQKLPQMDRPIPRCLSQNLPPSQSADRRPRINTHPPSGPARKRAIPQCRRAGEAAGSIQEGRHQSQIQGIRLALEGRT